MRMYWQLHLLTDWNVTLPTICKCLHRNHDFHSFGMCHFSPFPHPTPLINLWNVEPSSHCRELLDAGQLISISGPPSLGGEGDEGRDGEAVWQQILPQDMVGGRTPSEDLEEGKQWRLSWVGGNCGFPRIFSTCFYSSTELLQEQNSRDVL